VKILLGDYNAKEGKEDIFKPTIGNESLYEINNDSGVRLVKFATSKNPTPKSMIYIRYDIYHLKMAAWSRNM
jgi:hypothetical protein